MPRKRCLTCAMVLLVAAFVAAPSDARADDGTWVTVGAANFSAGEATHTSLAFQPSTKQPYVAYGDSANGGKVTVKRFDGTNWITVGAAGFSAGWVDHLSLAFDLSTSQPYVAYGGGGNPGRKVTVMRFDGANWVTVGAAGGTYGTFASSLAFDPSTSQPYLAYSDSTSPGTKVTVMRFDGANWVTVGPSSVSYTAPEGKYAAISLVFNLSTNQPYVAYQDRDNSYKAIVKRFDGANWVTVGVAGFSAGQADYISLAFDPSTSQPYVAYRDRGNGFKGTVMRFDGAKWVTVGAAFSAGQAVYISLAFNPYTQKPYVAFSDVGINGRAAVKRFDGTDWVNVGAAGFSAISASYISLAFDLAASQPYVAYGFLKANVMKFAASQQPQLAPKIVRAETFREGVLVFFRLFFTDPNNDAIGFGFRGANGAGWAEETHPFSNPSYGRVSPGRVEYPFNHGCGTGSQYQSDVEAWIYDSAGLHSPSVTVHLACSAPSK